MKTRMLRVMDAEQLGEAFVQVGATEQEWGPRCDEYEPGCPACEAWRLFDECFRCPTVEEVNAASRQALGDAAAIGEEA